MDREQKTAVVEELADELKDAQAIFAVDYRGISVPQAAELRAGLRDADARFRVVKNRLTLRAADEAGTDALKELPGGPDRAHLRQGRRGAGGQDARPPRRRVGAARLQGRPDGRRDARRRLVHGDRPPARAATQLNAQFAGVVASPLTGLVRGLGSMIQGLALQLGQIAEQGLVSGEAPRGGRRPQRQRPPQRRGGDPPSPSRAESPEESSEEQAPEGEDAGQGEAAETGGRRRDRRGADGEEPAEETSEDSDENKEEGS